MHIYDMTLGQLTVLGYLEGMMEIWPASCVVLLVGRRSCGNYYRTRQHRATAITMDLENAGGGFDMSAW